MTHAGAAGLHATLQPDGSTYLFMLVQMLLPICFMLFVLVPSIEVSRLYLCISLSHSAPTALRLQADQADVQRLSGFFSSSPQPRPVLQKPVPTSSG